READRLARQLRRRRRGRGARGARRSLGAPGRAAGIETAPRGHRVARRWAAGEIPSAARPEVRRGPEARGGLRHPEAAPRHDEAERPSSHQRAARGVARLRPRRSEIMKSSAKKTSSPGLALRRALRSLHGERAPESLLPAVLARIGLGDRYWRLESP